MEDFSFDATDVPPAQDVSDPLPPDWYGTMITKTTLKDTKSTGGKILEVEHTVLEGPMKGRKAWSRFNVVNPSEKAEAIGREQLSALCHAVNVLKFRTHEQLVDKRCLIRVIVKQDPGYAPANEVKAWKDYTAPTSVPPRASTRPNAPAPVAAGDAKDPDAWRKNAEDGLPF